MTDHDKVIKGLEHCADDGCKGCPYNEDCYMEDGLTALVRDALAMLKAQEPRVLKPNEICNLTFDSAWVELKHNKDLTLVEWDKPTLLTLLWTVGPWDSYGKLWRCWTHRPTDEQREATPWD